MNEVWIAHRGFIKTVTRGFLFFVFVAAFLAPPGLSQQRKQATSQPDERQGESLSQKGAAIPSEIRAALDHVSVDSLRGHLSFIASDLLEGRNTPSRGLDIAAEYIAAQFRRAGLEPAGDVGGESYFQTSEWGVGPVRD